jgi:hypothetical protein
MVEGEELGAIARRVIDSNQFMTTGTADEERVPWVSPVWYAPAGYGEYFRELPKHIRLRLVEAVPAPGVTHLRYEVER